MYKFGYNIYTLLPAWVQRWLKRHHEQLSVPSPPATKNQSDSSDKENEREDGRVLKSAACELVCLLPLSSIHDFFFSE